MRTSPTSPALAYRLLAGPAAALSILAAACGGDVGASCAEQAECASDLVCVGPSEDGGCGIAPAEGCATQDACEAGTFCHAIGDGCAAFGVGSACGPSCTLQACDEGFRCNGDTCEPIPCDQGAPCAAHERCDPTFAPGTPGHLRHAGCLAIECLEDADCPSAAACVNQVCQSGAGTCRELEVRP